MSSVKVAVRVRPFNEREKGSKCCVDMVSKAQIDCKLYMLVLTIDLPDRTVPLLSW